MELTFLGANNTVTGSKTLVKDNAKKILVDCGLFQGYKELRLRNWTQLPIPAKAIDAVVLTHAHIDHTGYIPLLVKNGFTGNIYCSEGTKDLCEVLLPDSGHLQEEESRYANKHAYSKHKPALPLYTLEDAKIALKQFVTQPYLKPFSIAGDNELKIQLIPSGHIIGSSFVRLQNKQTSVLFTGDLGRPHDAIMKAPQFVSAVDYLVLESTYGDRQHEKSDPKETLKNIINETVSHGGSVIIPSFAVGRAQSLLYYFYLLKSKNEIPNIPIYLDSPMAIDATEIFIKYCDEHRLSNDICQALGKVATYTRAYEESQAIDNDPTPKIIISASGMVTGGRILHHIKAYGPNPKNTILFTGFQSGGTRGERIEKGIKEIKMLGENVNIRAKVASITNLSAHADYEETLEWLSHFNQAPKHVFINHGEQTGALSLQKKIQMRFGWNCSIPHYLQHEILK